MNLPPGHWHSLKRALSSSTLLFPGLAPQAAAQVATRPIASFAGTLTLTRREQEVLALLCYRQTDREIAVRLSISPRTAESHVAHILEKCGARNRREAATLACSLDPPN